MNKLSRTIIATSLVFLIILGLMPGKLVLSVGGVPIATAADTIYNQDGIGFSKPIASLNEIEGTYFTGYQNWPSGFSKGSSAFSGGVYDGTNIWLIPHYATKVIKFNPETDEMTAYDNWPEGFTRGSYPFLGGVFDGENIWLIPYSASSLIKLDPLTGEMESYSNWPGDIRGTDQFMGAAFDGTHIWLAPYIGTRVIKVDLDGVMSSYTNWPSGIQLGSYPFAGVIYDGTDIWLIPQDADSIVKVEAATGNMSRYDDWPSDFNKGLDAFRGGIYDGSHIWLIPYNASHLIRFNPTDGTMEKYDWPAGYNKSSSSFVGGVYDGTNIWLIPMNANSLLKVNPTTGDMTEYDNYPSGFVKTSFAFFGGVYDGQNLWMVPYNADRLMKFGESKELSNLEINGVSLSPNFSSKLTSYSNNVDYSVSSIEVVPTAIDASATVSVNGTTVVSGNAQAIPLNVGSNTISIVVTTSSGDTKTYTVEVTRANDTNNGGNNQVVVTNEPHHNTSIIINGQTVNIGEVTTSTRNAQTVTTIAINLNILDHLLQGNNERPVVTITDNNDSEVIIGELSAAIFKKLAEKDAILEIKTDKGSYTVAFKDIDIEAILLQTGSTDDIMIQFEMGSSSAETIQKAQDAAKESNLLILAPPMDFSVKVIYGHNQLEVSKFNNYIKRSITLPSNSDGNRILTGVVLDENGQFRHVPTVITQQDGKWFADIRSLTNSTYTIVEKYVAFEDIDNHWASLAIHDMSARLIVEGTSDALFNPDKLITRAEFTAMVVRALGLKLESNGVVFADVKETDWYNQAVKTAMTYQLVSGFEDGSFKPKEAITREQAMHIMAKAMGLTGLKAQIQIQDANLTLQPFIDGEQASLWAKNGVALSIQAGIINGRSVEYLALKENVTRAEVAIMLQQLLSKSNLIK